MIGTPDGTFTGISSQANPGASGDAGVVVVRARDLRILKGGTIVSTTAGPGNAGTIEVHTSNLLIDGTGAPDVGTGIFSNAVTGSSGNAGEVVVMATDLQISNSGEIGSATSGSGDAGSVEVRADQILIDGFAAPIGRLTGITSSSESDLSGNAGSVIIATGNLQIRDGGLVASETFGGGRRR